MLPLTKKYCFWRESKKGEKNKMQQNYLSIFNEAGQLVEEEWSNSEMKNRKEGKFGAWS